MRNKLVLIGAVSATFVLSNCGSSSSRRAAALTGGDSHRGAAALTRYGCGSCHTIAGISGADGLVGPPLTGVGDRFYIAGSLPNNAQNLEHWVRDPKAVNQNTAMPNLGVTTGDAVDIAAYLYSLK